MKRLEKTTQKIFSLELKYILKILGFLFRVSIF